MLQLFYFYFFIFFIFVTTIFKKKCYYFFIFFLLQLSLYVLLQLFICVFFCYNYMQTFYFQIVHRHVFEGLKVEFDTIAEGGFNKFAIHKNITVVFKTDGKSLIYNTFFS